MVNRSAVARLEALRERSSDCSPLSRICGHFRKGTKGGIDEATAPMAVAAEVNVLVAGTSVFGTHKRVGAAMESLRNAVTQVAQ